MSKNFEDIFKDKFKDFEAPLSADLFDKIQAQRARKSRFLWMKWAKWSAAVLLVLTLLKVGYYQLSTLESLPEEVLVEETTSNTQEPQLNAEENGVSETETQENSSAQENIEVANEIIEAVTPVLPLTSESDRDAVTGPVEPIETDLTFGIQPGTVAPAEPTAPEGDFGRGMVEKTESDEGVEETEVSVAESPEAPSQPKTAEPSDGDADLDETKADEQIVDSDEQQIDDQDANDKSNDGNDNYFNNLVRSRFSVDLLAGPGYGSRMYIGDQQLAGLRRTTESPSVSYQAEAALSCRINNYWSAGVGINYLRRNEIFTFDQHFMSFDTSTSSREVVIYDPVRPPKTIVVFDTTITTKTDVVKNGSRNAYTRISVPVYLERSIYRSNKWSVSANAGAMFTLRSFQKGIARVGLSEMAQLNTLEFSRTGSVSSTLGLSARYRLNKNIHLVLAPQFNFDLNNSRTGSLGLDMKQYGVYTRFGFRYNF